MKPPQLQTIRANHGMCCAVQSVMSGLGLGMIVDQLADLKLGELLDTPPPGLDEAVAIAKARAGPAQFVCSETSPCLPSLRSCVPGWHAMSQGFHLSRPR